MYLSDEAVTPGDHVGRDMTQEDLNHLDYPALAKHGVYTCTLTLISGGVDGLVSGNYKYHVIMYLIGL